MLWRAGRSCKRILRHTLATSFTLSTRVAACTTLRLRSYTTPAAVFQDRDKRQSLPRGPPEPESANPPSLSTKDRDRVLKNVPPELLAFLKEPHNGLSASQLLERIPHTFGRVSGRKISLVPLFTDVRHLDNLFLRLLERQEPALALRALSVAQRIGVARLDDRRTWEKLGHAIAAKGRWELMPGLVALARSSLNRLTARLLRWWSRSLVEIPNYRALRQVPHVFKREGVKMDRGTYHFVLSGHIRNHDLAAAMHTLELMKVDDLPPDASTQAIIASAYRALGPDTEVRRRALQALRGGDARSSIAVLNALLQLSVDAEDVEWIGISLELLGLDHIDLYRKLNPHGSSFLPEEEDFQDEDITLSAQTIEAVTTFRIVRSALQIRPDVASYTILLNYAAVKGDWKSSVSLLAHMYGQGIKPDELLVCALLRVLFAVKKPIAALRIVDDICGSNPTAQQVLASLAEDIPAQDDEELPSIDIEPSVAVLNVLASGLSPILGISVFNRVLDLMAASDLQPDSRTIEVLAARLLADENADEAAILSAIRHLISALPSVSLRHCDVLLQAVIRRSTRARERSAWIPQSTRQKFGVLARSPAVEDALAAAAGNALDGPTAGLSLLDPALDAQFSPLVQSLADRGVHATRSMLGLRLQYEALRANMHTARAVFQSMLDRGMYPTAHHYAMLMQGYALAGSVEDALRVRAAAERAGVPPNAVMYTVLIAAYARMGEPELAMQALGEMLERGVPPDVPSINAAVSAHAHLGLWSAARRTLMALWPKDHPLPANDSSMSVQDLMYELHNRRPVAQAHARKYSQEHTARLRQALPTIVDRLQRESEARAKDEWEEAAKDEGTKAAKAKKKKRRATVYKKRKEALGA